MRKYLIFIIPFVIGIISILILIINILEAVPTETVPEIVDIGLLRNEGEIPETSQLGSILIMKSWKVKGERKSFFEQLLTIIGIKT